MKSLSTRYMESLQSPRKTLTTAEMNLEAWLAEELGITFSEFEGEAFITGNGNQEAQRHS